ncbi:hypothetical protein [Pseudomonas syringae]|uniref:hypothetical protein n=1 Tax=Pseudomonas syringae TaxID=317 RepID=UPI0007EE5FB4|nr:hypothetical protein [Pseudomonas syringae]OBS35395.1 hypothetical protein A9K81_08220 [Pseudomonas syringae pv. syringae]
MVTVLIDNCAWDRLWQRNVHLPDEQGLDLRFSVSSFGLIEIPSGEHPSEKARAVGAYAREQLAFLEAEQVVWFGFQDEGKSNSRVGGFGDLQPDGTVLGGGFLTSVEGRDYRQKNESRIGGETGSKVKKSGLLSNETDVDYGEWSFGLPVATMNVKDFKGAGTIIDLEKWHDGSFGDFVRACLVHNLQVDDT